ncbi:MAG: hypothetical protein AB1938_32460 [Myxococcota bacterium]
MVECEIHGLSFIAPCCEHLQDAVLETRERLRAFVVIDGLGDPNYLCAACHARAKAWLDSYASGAASPEPPFSETGVCGQCMRDWYLETGQGDRSDAVVAARAERADIEVRRTATLAAAAAKSR